MITREFIDLCDECFATIRDQVFTEVNYSLEDVDYEPTVISPEKENDDNGAES